MSNEGILARIDAWQADDLIDAETGARLRAAESMAPDAGGNAGRAETSLPLGGAGAIFGPGIAVGEMFAYLGGAFLLGAWFALVARLAGGPDGVPSSLTLAIGALVAAAALGALGLATRDRAPRLRRGAGVAFLLSAVQTGAA